MLERILLFFKKQGKIEKGYKVNEESEGFYSWK